MSNAGIGPTSTEDFAHPGDDPPHTPPSPLPPGRPADPHALVYAEEGIAEEPAKEAPVNNASPSIDFLRAALGHTGTCVAAPGCRRFCS